MPAKQRAPRKQCGRHIAACLVLAITICVGQEARTARAATAGDGPAATAPAAAATAPAAAATAPAAAAGVGASAVRPMPSDTEVAAGLQRLVQAHRAAHRGGQGAGAAGGAAEGAAGGAARGVAGNLDGGWGWGRVGPMLSPRQLQRAMYAGDTERVRAVVRRMAAGQPIAIALVGGSVTLGMGAVEGEPSYQAWLQSWLEAVGLAGSVKLLNAACAATPSSYMNMCLREYLTDDAVDLVVVDYAINDELIPMPLMANEARRSLELLLRKLLSLPRRPAVALLNMYRWWAESSEPGAGRPGAGLYYSNAEAQYFEFATYYGLQLLSLKAAVYHQMVAGQHGYRADSLMYKQRGNATFEKGALFYEDPMHPSGLTGHRAVAELVVGMLMHVARGLLARPWRRAEEAALAAPLPRHLVPGSEDAAADMCLVGERLRAAAAESQGFEWRNEGRDPRSPKWGFTANATGATLALRALPGNAPSATAATAASTHSTHTLGQQQQPRLVVLVLAYLRSYEGMGTADLSCEGGCICGEAALAAARAAAAAGGAAADVAMAAEAGNMGAVVGDGMSAVGETAGAEGGGGEGAGGAAVAARLDGHWAVRESQLQLGCVPALLGPGGGGCTLRVTVGAASGSGGHKVKVGGLMLSSSAPAMARDMCTSSLEAAQRIAGYRQR